LRVDEINLSTTPKTKRDDGTMSGHLNGPDTHLNA
jgi:hypothetical protein